LCRQTAQHRCSWQLCLAPTCTCCSWTQWSMHRALLQVCAELPLRMPGTLTLVRLLWCCGAWNMMLVLTANEAQHGLLNCVCCALCEVYLLVPRRHLCCAVYRCSSSCNQLFAAAAVATICVYILQVLVGWNRLTWHSLWRRSSACRQQHRLCGCCVLTQCEQVGWYTRQRCCRAHLCFAAHCDTFVWCV
jgi:hypothetical protein